MSRLLHIFVFSSFACPAFAAPADFDKDIRPVLEARCVTCHGPEKQKGDLRLDTLKSDFSHRDSALTWLEVRDQINLGEMPPEDAALGFDKVGAALLTMV